MMIIEVKDLVLGYDSKALTTPFSFTVDEGEYVAIIGENGVGKSTLIRTLLHFVRPLSGSITLSGGLKPASIGYMPQQTEVAKDFPALVSEIILSGLQGGKFWRPFYTKKDRERCQQIALKLEIADILHEPYQQLSGGLKQRVLLARALLAAERLLLLDEPVSGLDPEATANFYRLVADLNREGKTVIVVTHDLEHGLKDATKVIRISDRQSSVVSIDRGER